MASRRKQGVLEHEVLAALWAAGEPQTPEQVRNELDADLAYTTVQTILTRLYGKGVVGREQAGRAFVYAPVVEDEAGLTARRMHQLLAADVDHASVLSRFAASLSPAEAKALRKALGGRSS